MHLWKNSVECLVYMYIVCQCTWVLELHLGFAEEKLRALVLHNHTRRHAKITVFWKNHRYNEGVKSTRRKLRTVNPIFQEIFSFTSEEAELQETKVCIDLFDHDLVGSDDFLGEAVIDISKMNLSNELTYSEWFMLQHQVKHHFLPDACSSFN